MLDIDGNSYSGRFPLALATGSVVFKMATFSDFASLIAIPWEHYVPVDIGLSDLDERLKWARANDAEIEKIGRQGQ